MTTGPVPNTCDVCGKHFWEYFRENVCLSCVGEMQDAELDAMSEEKHDERMDELDKEHKR